MAVRKRKTHKKSRRGCGNCKLRRVKCDERQPGCVKCESYGVTCNYGDPDLQLAFDGGVPMKFSTNETIMKIAYVEASGRNPDVLDLSASDLELLNFFQTQTVFSIGTSSTVGVYQKEVPRLAASHPWLMHCMLALAAMHRRSLRGHRISADEELHSYQGAAMFREVLSRPVRNEDKDALWGAAALLGAASFYRVDGDTPEDVWPIDSTKDLGWLGLSDGKKAVAAIAELHRPESIFRKSFEEHQRGWSVDWTLIPPNFKEAGIGGMPYRAAASTVANLLQEECNHGTIMRFLNFISRIQPEYRQLLEAKDSRALLVLAYWYAKVCTYNQWWLRKRALLECQSICIYLERYHKEDEELMKLVEYPKMMCGLISPHRGLVDELGRPLTPMSTVSDPMER